MLITDDEIIKGLRIKPTDRVLDIGGSMMQHPKIKVDTVADLIRPEEAPYSPSKLLAKNFVKVDITREKLPFKDKEFDIVLCTHTLEDLSMPFSVIAEMERVGKKGVIVTPAMGQDMVFSPVNFTDWLTGARRIPGDAHHRWFFINKGKVVKILPKVFPILYTSEFQVLRWSGKKEMVYYWDKNIEYEEFPGINIHALIDEYKKYMGENKDHIKKGTAVLFVDNPLNWFKAAIRLFLKKGAGYRYRKT